MNHGMTQHDTAPADRVADPVVRIYDTTLRDGAQTPGVAFSRAQQEEIALALDDIGVDEIEVGFAASGPAQREDMAALVGLGLRARTLSLARPLRRDVDDVLETGVDGVILVTSLSGIHLEYKLRKSFDVVLDEACDAIAYAVGQGLFVQLSLEDATRTAPESLACATRALVSAGADRIGLADTVGVATPMMMDGLIRTLAAVTDTPISVHCHDDFGLAVANTLAAVQAGATAVSTTVNGIGERSGNAATEECVAGLTVLLGRRTNVRLDGLTAVSRLVAQHSRIPLPPVKAVVGRNSFRHESGIHVAAMLRNPACYEPYDPALVGGSREYVLGKTSGRAALRHLGGARGADLDDVTCRRLLDEIKVLSEHGGAVTEAAVVELIDRLLAGVGA